uniref:HYC_CC_PP family protein n=1 Tax=Gelidibacter sp. TaxID=2018083 RepID=UPI00404A80EC
MKSFFTKILSFFLAVFILFSTSSFTVDMHFCCNKLVDMAFFNTYINLFEGLEENVISFKTYRPPLLSTDIIILNETFLI